jgi:hypothetical protein
MRLRTAGARSGPQRRVEVARLALPRRMTLRVPTQRETFTILRRLERLAGAVQRLQTRIDEMRPPDDTRVHAERNRMHEPYGWPATERERG